MSKKFTVLAVNGGNGVICYPFRKQLVGNIEERTVFKTPGDIQWKLNFPNVQLYKDGGILPSFESPDIIIGAPDCGHSSMLSLSRIKKFSDPKENASLALFLNSITMLKPKAWLMENLPKLLDTYTVSDLEKYFGNYQLIFAINSVSAYGNSQKTRKRLVIIGIRNDIYKHKKFKKRFTPYPVKELKLSSELIEGLKPGKKCHISEPLDKEITMYAGYKIYLSDVKKLWTTSLADQSRWPVSDPGKAFQNAPGVYKNLKSRYPMTARRQNRQFNHHGIMMSPRELARIQGIPDKFKIWQDDSRQEFCINKGRTTVAKTPPVEIPIWFKQEILKLIKDGLF